MKFNKIILSQITLQVALIFLELHGHITYSQIPPTKLCLLTASQLLVLEKKN
jgi:hypothetical protein